MQKIMFNDRYGLTDLVLSGKKRQTRRVVKEQYKYPDKKMYWDTRAKALCFCGKGSVVSVITPRYYIGEIVAVAMSYKSIYERIIKAWEYAEEYKNKHKDLAGWNNKMFTNTKMPFATIKITNIRVEKLQDISGDDCLAEGIKEETHKVEFKRYTIGDIEKDTPQEAYASLIDKVSGKGTWESNPYVWIYDFELVK